MKKLFCILLTIIMTLSLAVSVAAQEIYYGEEFVCVTDGYDFTYESYHDSFNEFSAFINFEDRYAEIELYGTRTANAKREFNQLKASELASGGEVFYINGTPAVKTYDDEFVCAFVITYSDNYIYHIDVETEDTMDCDYLLHMLSTDFYFKGGNTPPVPFGSTSSVGSASGSSSGSASGSSGSASGSSGTASGSSGSASSSSGTVSGSTATPAPTAPTTKAPASSIVTNNYTTPVTTSTTITSSTNATTAEPVISVVYETVTVPETSATEQPKEKTNNILKIGIIIFVIVALAGLVIGIVEIVSSKKKKNS